MAGIPLPPRVLVAQQVQIVSESEKGPRASIVLAGVSEGMAPLRVPSLDKDAVALAEHEARERCLLFVVTIITLGRFEITKVLGQGAFGTVYRAHDPQLDRQVALKVPRSGVLVTENDPDRFLREARAAAFEEYPKIRDGNNLRVVRVFRDKIG